MIRIISCIAGLLGAAAIGVVVLVILMVLAIIFPLPVRTKGGGATDE